MRCLLTTVLAGLLLSQYAMAAPIAVSSYAYDTAGWLPHSNANYQDNGYYAGDQSPTPTELTNGVLGTVPSPFSDPEWVGIGPDQVPDDGLVQPGLTFDLGTFYNLSSLSIHYLSDNPSESGSGVRAPDSVDISFSDDGTTFTTPFTFSGFLNQDVAFGPPLAFTALIDVTGNSGQFARLEFFNDAPWTFLSEIEFEGEVPFIPEPSSLTLIGLGIIGLGRYRRRRAA